MRQFVIAMLLLPGLACTTSLPGEVDAGLFDFVASTAVEESCKPHMAVEGSFKFEGRFRLESNLVDGYFLYRNTHRQARFDGQNMRSVHEARHSLVEGCENCERRVIETLEVVLLSETQDEALGGQCPCSAPGEEIPVDEAQNIFPPRPVPGGFDAVRACGTLRVYVEATPLTEEGCQGCHQEAVSYYIEGIRRE